MLIKNELLQQKYLTPMELQKLLRVPYNTALRYAHGIQEEMKKENNNEIILESRVPKKYFDKYVLCIKDEDKEVNQK